MLFIAEAKAATGRAKIAIERAADEYTLAAKIYDSQVRGLIMGAKEFAALVEREMLLVDESKAALDLDKEDLRQEKLKAEIIMEAVAQGQAVSELAKAELAVDKELLTPGEDSRATFTLNRSTRPRPAPTSLKRISPSRKKASGVRNLKLMSSWKV